MSRNHLRLDLEDLRGGHANFLHNSPVLAVMTTPDFLKEVNFHQKIATFGRTPPNDWSNNDIREYECIGSPESSLPYISNGYMTDPYLSCSLEYELSKEMGCIGRLIKPEPSPEPTSEKELTGKEFEDKLKLERRRMKNREAAHRCRRRKIEKIADLEGQVRALQNENSRILENIKRLEEEAVYLRTLCQQKQQRCPHCD